MQIVHEPFATDPFLHDIYCILDTLPPLPALPDVPQKTYVDPLIYVDVLDAAKEFTKEIDSASLTLEHLIGAGINLLFYSGLMSLVNLLSAKLCHNPEIASSCVEQH